MKYPLLAAIGAVLLANPARAAGPDIVTSYTTPGDSGRVPGVVAMCPSTDGSRTAIPCPSPGASSTASPTASGTSATQANPVQGVTGGVPVPVSASSLPLPAGAAQDGTDAVGVAGNPGTGIRGWLSSLNNTLSAIYVYASTTAAATRANDAAASRTQTHDDTMAAAQAGAGLRVQPAVGAAAIATAQSAPGTTATQLVAARTGAPGTGRVAATIFNVGSVTIYLGGPGVTPTTGVPVAAGAALTLNTTAALFGVTASGTGAAAALEAF